MVIITIIEFLITLMAHSAFGIYSSTLKYNKRLTHLIWGIWILLQGSLFFYSEFILKSTTTQFLFGFVLSLIGQYIIFLTTTKGKLAQKIFTILTYSIFFCIYMTLFNMIKGTFTNVNNVILSLANGIVFLTTVFCILKYVCPIYQSIAKYITTGWHLLIFVNIFFLVAVILSSVFPVRLNSFNYPSVITFIFLCMSILVVYPVIFSNIKNMSEVAIKRAVENQNKLLLAQIEQENSQLLADSQARHDRRHHNLVMLEFANTGDIDSLKEYLKKLVHSEDNIRYDVKHCDNRTINTVLTVYERRAIENDIHVSISANASHNLSISPNDIVIIVANLFENAINATSKIKHKNKLIDISIKENAHRLLIKVENTCKDKLAFDESLYGIGISSVISIAQKYEGMYDFSAYNGSFSAKVSLNI